MKMEKSFTIDGEIVIDTKQRMMGLRIFEIDDVSDANRVLYIVDSKDKVKTKITMSVDGNDEYGFISEYSFEDVTGE